MAQRQSHSFSPLSLLAISLLAVSANGFALSTSVFPNSACAGASSSQGGLVGIGQVILSTGEIETHCGCPSDNLPLFSACPSSAEGESVCNSILNLQTGSFSASCAVVACRGAACPRTVVNTVVVDDEDCIAEGKGSIGYTTVDGESKCGCAATSAAFTACPSVANGRASCVARDADFLGMSFKHEEEVACGIICDAGYFLTPGGACTQLEKRANVPVGPSGAFHPAYTKVVKPATHSGGPSASWSHGYTKVVPVPTHRPIFHEGTSSHPVPAHTGSTTHRGIASYVTHRPIWGHSTPVVKVYPTPTTHRGIGASQGHHTPAYHPTGVTKVVVHPTGSSAHHHTPAYHPSGHHTSAYHPAGVTKAVVHPTGSAPHHHASSSWSPSGVTKVVPGASQRAHLVARAPEPQVEELVFEPEQCAQSQRVCPIGAFGAYECVRLDDVNQCGGCAATGEATDCLAVPGVASAACLRGGCVIRACQAGFEQSSEGACTPKA